MMYSMDGKSCVSENNNCASSKCKIANEVDVLRMDYKKYKDKSLDLRSLFSTFSKYLDTCRVKEITSKNPIFLDTFKSYEVVPDLGFFYIPNPFAQPTTLMSLLKEAVKQWPTTDNKMNLDIEHDRPQNIWESCLDFVNSGKRLKETWLYKLHWVSLGYHYNWTQRCYKPDDKSEFPATLGNIAKIVASWFDFPDYAPEAGIVNYYGLNSAMCFHVDEAEFAKEIPLISLSLGQSAIYLLGGLTRDVPAIPVILNHGDLVVMTGPSRLAYHAVPRVFHTSTHLMYSRVTGVGDSSTPVLYSEETLNNDVGIACWQDLPKDYVYEKDVIDTDTNCERDSNHLLTTCDHLECKILWSFVKSHRINVNVRQVLRAGQSFPE